MAVTPAKVSEWLNKLPGSWESPAATPAMMTLWCRSCISYRKKQGSWRHAPALRLLERIAVWVPWEAFVQMTSLDARLWT